jgi:hypothetical protein
VGRTEERDLLLTRIGNNHTIYISNIAKKHFLNKKPISYGALLTLVDYKPEKELSELVPGVVNHFLSYLTTTQQSLLEEPEKKYDKNKQEENSDDLPELVPYGFPQ